MSENITLDQLRELLKLQALDQAQVSKQQANEQADLYTKRREVERSEDLVKYTE